MTKASSVKTFEALKALGFKPDASTSLFEGETLSYDFGNLTLSARQTLNRNFVEIISVSGVYAKPRTIAEVEIQLPLNVASEEQCAAFIAWGIKNQIGANFTPLMPADWLETGRNNFDILPWVKKQNLYLQRPKCIADRDWLKLALRDLRLLLPELEESELISFTFRDKIFSIRTGAKTIAFPAAGTDWALCYQISTAAFRNFPRRLNSEQIEISVWEDHLHLENWRYSLEKTTDVEI